ncbi:hypothetical protein C8A05DRAFT_12886 [Staphylotrichum tortipilum]|uniref:Uncharacterized protein n=1 Tax=Staphylotrichum tortipilum TaxID=2831512 RepID=A0AAN6RVS2_9PEZI|nr:hypothetical protein C8A05DRAFT_12886 [Staphylotrichum longicolle]
MPEIASRSAASASVSASASSASTILTSVESMRDDNPPTTQFTSIQDLFEVINCTTGDFLAVTNVSPILFTEIERKRDKRRRKFRFRRYESDRQILFITIPTDLHELHFGLYQGYHNKLVRSGRGNSWRTIGTATRRAQQGHPGGDGGEGDSTGGPKPERGMKRFWPTLVIEAGDSESLSELHNDMRWWFFTSEHQVRIVLLAKFDHTRRALILEKWEEESSMARPGATTTRHAAALQPVLRQTITITEDVTTNPVSYNVARGALVLGFRFLFLRDPGPGEGDFVLSVQELQAYAEEVWKML